MAPVILNGPEDVSGIPHQSFGKLLLEAMKKHPPGNTALIDIKTTETLTYGQLCQLGQNLAASLRLLSVNKGDVIGIAAENSSKLPVVYLAALLLAAPLHLINPKFTQYELHHILNMTKPKLVFYSNKSRDNLVKVKNELSFIQKIICLDDDDVCDAMHYRDLINKTRSFKIDENIDVASQTAVICNSSGTTGVPKGVMVSHQNLRMHFVLASTPGGFCIHRSEVIPVALPLFHIYGVHILNSCLYVGATLAILDKFNPKIFLQTVQDYRVKRLFVVPTLINFLVENPLVKQYNLSALEEIVTGGSFLNPEDYELLCNRFSLKRFHAIYGITEMSGVVVQGCNLPTGCCGKAAPGTQLKIVDCQSGQNLPACKYGEICIRGNVMIGYFNDVKKTNEMIDSDGFLHTGDLGYYIDDGCVYVIGRIKEIIKYKSFQVSPVELENIIMRHPDVSDVAIVGRPDRRFGELPTALIVKKDSAKVTPQQICDYVSTYVSDEKRLHGGVRFVEAIPRTPLGKIERHKLYLSLNKLF